MGLKSSYVNTRLRSGVIPSAKSAFVANWTLWRDCARPRDRRMLWIMSKIRPVVSLSYIKAVSITLVIAKPHIFNILKKEYSSLNLWYITAARRFDTIHNILRFQSLAMSLKNRKAPIWRQREPTHMSLSRTDGVKKFGIPNDSLGIFNDKFKESEIISMSLIWPRVTWLPSKLWNRNRDSKHLTWVRERAPPCWKSYRPFGRSRASQSKPCSPPGGPGTSPGCGAVPKRPSKV